MHFEVTAEQAQQYRTEGYVLFDAVMPPDVLEMLREECAFFVRREDEKMDRLGVDHIGITHRDKRYHAGFASRDRAVLGDWLFSEIPRRICEALVGPDAYLFFDGFVVKGAEGGLKLAWHQDSGYVNASEGDLGHRPYLTLWCPLDDVDESNGSIYILPASQSGVRGAVPHQPEEGSNDWVGYDGPAKGVPVIAKAGSIAVFSSVTLHCSGPNNTDRMRRAYISQYSPEPVLTADRERLWGFAVPFLRDGHTVTGEPEPNLPHRVSRLGQAKQP